MKIAHFIKSVPNTWISAAALFLGLTNGGRTTAQDLGPEPGMVPFALDAEACLLLNQDLLFRRCLTERGASAELLARLSTKSCTDSDSGSADSGVSIATCRAAEMGFAPHEFDEVAVDRCLHESDPERCLALLPNFPRGVIPFDLQACRIEAEDQGLKSCLQRRGMIPGYVPGPGDVEHCLKGWLFGQPVAQEVVCLRDVLIRYGFHAEHPVVESCLLRVPGTRQGSSLFSLASGVVGCLKGKGVLPGAVFSVADLERCLRVNQGSTARCLSDETRGVPDGLSVYALESAIGICRSAEGSRASAESIYVCLQRSDVISGYIWTSADVKACLEHSEFGLYRLRECIADAGWSDTPRVALPREVDACAAGYESDLDTDALTNCLHRVYGTGGYLPEGKDFASCFASAGGSLAGVPDCLERLGWRPAHVDPVSFQLSFLHCADEHGLRWAKVEACLRRGDPSASVSAALPLRFSLDIQSDLLSRRCSACHGEQSANRSALQGYVVAAEQHQSHRELSERILEEIAAQSSGGLEDLPFIKTISGCHPNTQCQGADAGSLLPRAELELFIRWVDEGRPQR